MFFVYAVYNIKADKIYIGQTNNLQRRLCEHNSGRGKHFTTKLEGEWILIHCESMPTRPQAIKREKQLKTYRGREYIKSLI